MKTYGNIILMTVICIVIFWVFMALRPAQAPWQQRSGVVFQVAGFALERSSAS